MSKKNPVGMLAVLLVLVGALNWGLVGLGRLVGGGADWNLVHMLVGQWMQVEAVVYVLVGLAALYKIVMCSTGKCSDCDCPCDGSRSCGCGDAKCSCGNPNCHGECKKPV